MFYRFGQNISNEVVILPGYNLLHNTCWVDFTLGSLTRQYDGSTAYTVRVVPARNMQLLDRGGRGKIVNPDIEVYSSYNICLID